MKALGAMEAFDENISGLLLRSCDHSKPMSSPNEQAIFPPNPIGFVGFSSSLHREERKYIIRGGVLDKHCKALFIKQVLPRLVRPTNPPVGV